MNLLILTVSVENPIKSLPVKTQYHEKIHN